MATIPIGADSAHVTFAPDEDKLTEHLGKARALSRASRELELDKTDLEWISYMLAEQVDRATAALNPEKGNG